mmetsp:Transcript_35484/g.68008  ORF Transcript_35484/g.68008 Transcript_35484/m.68008 type:complete len:248 (+) Transcript_35484:1270-2013(+)
MLALVDGDEEKHAGVPVSQHQQHEEELDDGAHAESNLAPELEAPEDARDAEHAEQPDQLHQLQGLSVLGVQRKQAARDLVKRNGAHRVDPEPSLHVLLENLGVVHDHDGVLGVSGEEVEHHVHPEDAVHDPVYVVQRRDVVRVVRQPKRDEHEDVQHHHHREQVPVAAEEGLRVDQVRLLALNLPGPLVLVLHELAVQRGRGRPEAVHRADQLLPRGLQRHEPLPCGCSCQLEFCSCCPLVRLLLRA